MSNGPKHALAPLAALAAVLLPPILAGRFWVPGDALIQLMPERRIALWALAHGEFPFWNPYIFGGMPLFAAIQAGVLMPLNWLVAPFGLAAGENLGLALAYLVLMGGMAAFARALAFPPAAAAVMALAFPLGGFVCFHTGSVGILQAAGLTAWLLWALERHALGGRRRYLLAAAFTACGMVFAGHPQTAAYGLILAGAYALVRGGGTGSVLARALALALGLGMALVQLLPTLDLIHASQRKLIDFAWLTSHSVAPIALPSLLFPAMFGVQQPSVLMAVPAWASDDWAGALQGYVGPVVWLLALTALARWRERLVRFWAVVALLGLVLSLGKHTPLYRLWALLPFVNQMPYASRHGFEETFALAVLAGYGVAWLLADPAGARVALRRASTLLAAALGVVWLALLTYGPGFAARTQPYIDQAPGAPHRLSLAMALAPWQAAFWLPPLLFAVGWVLAARRPGWLPWLVALDLWLFNWHLGGIPQLPHVPPDLVLSPAIDWSQGRSLALSRRRYPFEPGQDELALVRRYHYPDITMLSGEPTVNGYDAFIPARYGDLLGMDSFGHAGERDDRLWDPPHRALDLVGLSTLRLEPEVARDPAWQRRLASGRWQRLPDADGLVVLANRTALPHAWRVTSARGVDAATADAAVAGRQPFNPRREALLEGKAPATSFASGPATATSPSLNRKVVMTDGPGPGLVVLGTGYDPGWRAWDRNGHALEVWRADALLSAVAVPAGPQVVTLTYEPARWRWALGLALGSLLALLGWLGWVHPRARR